MNPYCIIVICEKKFTKIRDIHNGFKNNFEVAFRFFTTIAEIISFYLRKVENLLKGSLDSIPLPSVEIQITGRKVCLRCKGKPLAAGQQNFENKK